MSNAPAIRYVRTRDGFDIAYWKTGRGPPLLHSPNVQLGHLAEEWSLKGMQRWFTGLARSFSVVRYDHRGGGLSGRAEDGATPQSLDALVADIEAVADAVSAEPFILLGWLAGSLPVLEYAARHPDRVSHLVVWNGFARDRTHGQSPRLRSLFEMAAVDWELFTESICQAALGWRDAGEARRWASVTRAATTREEFLAYVAARRDWDATDALLRVRAPTLVLHGSKNALASEERSRELAAGIPDARFLACGSEGGAPDGQALEALRSFTGRGAGAAAGLEMLTPREREVLGLVVQGATNAEIAERLYISVNTVTRHLTHIYAKTGTRGRADAVRYALRRGGIEPS